MKRGEPGEESETHLDRQHTAEDFARRYFHDKEVKAYVSNLLREFRLDENRHRSRGFQIVRRAPRGCSSHMAFKQDRGDRDLSVLGEIRQGSLACLQPDNDGTREDEVPRLVAATKRAG
jgi:hypothetical protein